MERKSTACTCPRSVSWVKFPRWVRRERQNLIVCSLLVSIVALGGFTTWRFAEINAIRQDKALSEYAEILDSEATGAFPFRRQFSTEQYKYINPAEMAKRHLEYYGVPEAIDWRNLDRFRGLPDAKRLEVEVWLQEQALRYAHSAAERSDAEPAWRRALICLEHVSPSTRFAVLETQAAELRRLLGQRESAVRVKSEPDHRQFWVDEYLRGVDAEIQGRQEEALEHFLRVLKDQPGFFWVSYRAAAAECKLGLYHDAVAHLRSCVEQRPQNSILRRVYAGCLYSKGAFAEAEQEYDRARNLDPEHPETYLSRAFLDVRLKKTNDFVKDLLSYEGLKGLRGRNASSQFSISPSDLSMSGSASESDSSALRRFDPELVVARKGLAEKLLVLKEYQLARDQFELVLDANPGDVSAHWGLAQAIRQIDTDRADYEDAKVVAHPDVEEWIRQYPPAVFAFVNTASELIDQHQPVEAYEAAVRALKLADLHKKYQAFAHFVLARYFALVAQEEPSLRVRVLEELKEADRYRDSNFEKWVTKYPEMQPYYAEFTKSRSLLR